MVVCHKFITLGALWGYSTVGIYCFNPLEPAGLQCSVFPEPAKAKQRETTQNFSLSPPPYSVEFASIVLTEINKE